MVYKTIELPYESNALEPYMDKETVDVHYGKHHKGYTAKLNAALEKYPELLEKTEEELLSNLEAIPKDVLAAVRNNGGGHYNHNLFWEQMKLNENGKPEGELLTAIESAFGNFETFKEQFATAATTLFGSGWAWLVSDNSGQLSIVQTHNQDSPLSEGKTPLLGLDVWEHAYYLKYKNLRPDFVSAYWNIINWTLVAQRYEASKKE